MKLFRSKPTTIEYPMYFGASSSVLQKAKELRKRETKAERMLWPHLNRNQMVGLQFRRQHPINQFIVDFYCPKLKLAIELDGSIHEVSENKSYDSERTKILNDYGITILRFSNDSIEKDIDDVILLIKNIAEKLLIEAKKSPNWGI